MSNAGMASAVSKDFAARYRTDAAPILRNWGNAFLDFWSNNDPWGVIIATGFAPAFLTGLVLALLGNENGPVIGVTVFAVIELPLMLAYAFASRNAIPVPIWRTLALTDFLKLPDHKVPLDHPLRVLIRKIRAPEGHPEADFEIEYLLSYTNVWPDHALLWVYEKPFESAVRKPVASIQDNFSTVIPIPCPE